MSKKDIDSFKRVKQIALLAIYDTDPKEHLTEYARAWLLRLLDREHRLFDRDVRESIREAKIVSIVEGTLLKIRNDVVYRKSLDKLRGFGGKTKRAIYGWAGIDHKSPQQERLETLERKITRAEIRLKALTTKIEFQHEQLKRDRSALRKLAAAMSRNQNE